VSGRDDAWGAEMMLKDQTRSIRGRDKARGTETACTNCDSA
jgi:hypothetical protein